MSNEKACLYAEAECKILQLNSVEWGKIELFWKVGNNLSLLQNSLLKQTIKMQNTITIQILDINTKLIFVPSEMLKWIFPDDQTKKYFQIFCPLLP